jgi:prepilin-type processing-associated H-X9-DG protein
MPERVRIAFGRKIHVLPLNALLPLRQISAATRETLKYRRIAQSVAQLGLIEPLVVSRQNGSAQYLLLDGHVRYTALREQGSSEARCIISDEDEAFTYNRRVNRLAPIQEHYMIVRAIERGVSEEKLARALDVDIHVIRQRRHMLAGISADAVELLKDKPVGHDVFQKLRKMKPIRQLEVAEMMISANNYTANYAKALLATTKPTELVKPDDPKKGTGLSVEQMGRLEREMASVSSDYKELEASYGDDMLLLVIAAGYLERLLSKPEIERFLATRHAEFLEQFKAVISTSSLDQPTGAA